MYVTKDSCTITILDNQVTFLNNNFGIKFLDWHIPSSLHIHIIMVVQTPTKSKSLLC